MPYHVTPSPMSFHYALFRPGDYLLGINASVPPRPLPCPRHGIPTHKAGQGTKRMVSSSPFPFTNIVIIYCSSTVASRHQVTSLALRIPAVSQPSSSPEHQSISIFSSTPPFPPFQLALLVHVLGSQLQRPFRPSSVSSARNI